MNDFQHIVVEGHTHDGLRHRLRRLWWARSTTEGIGTIHNPLLAISYCGKKLLSDDITSYDVNRTVTCLSCLAEG